MNLDISYEYFYPNYYPFDAKGYSEEELSKMSKEEFNKIYEINNAN